MSVIEWSRMDDPTSFSPRPNALYLVNVAYSAEPLRCPMCGEYTALSMSLDGKPWPMPCAACTPSQPEPWPVERWRPVETELPPKGAKPVLVTNGATWAVASYYRAGRYDKAGWLTAGTWLDPGTITHWAPLPPLPTKEAR